MGGCLGDEAQAIINDVKPQDFAPSADIFSSSLPVMQAQYFLERAQLNSVRKGIHSFSLFATKLFEMVLWAYKLDNILLFP